MRYLARLTTDPAAWLPFLMIGGAVGTLLYLVVTSITF
jgi:hypothetical protein